MKEFAMTDRPALTVLVEACASSRELSGRAVAAAGFEGGTGAGASAIGVVSGLADAAAAAGPGSRVAGGPGVSSPA